MISLADEQSRDGRPYAFGICAIMLASNALPARRFPPRTFPKFAGSVRRPELSYWPCQSTSLRASRNGRSGLPLGEPRASSHKRSCLREPRGPAGSQPSREPVFSRYRTGLSRLPVRILKFAEQRPAPRKAPIQLRDFVNPRPETRRPPWTAPAVIAPTSQ